MGRRLALRRQHHSSGTAFGTSIGGGRWESSVGFIPLRQGPTLSESNIRAISAGTKNRSVRNENGKSRSPPTTRMGAPRVDQATAAPFSSLVLYTFVVAAMIGTDKGAVATNRSRDVDGKIDVTIGLSAVGGFSASGAKRIIVEAQPEETATTRTNRSSILSFIFSIPTIAIPSAGPRRRGQRLAPQDRRHGSRFQAQRGYHAGGGPA